MLAQSVESPLSIASRNCKTLLQTSDFLFIHKPHDVRMDGNFAVTCEKIIQHKWPGLRFRHCHQLDFATSGALAYAASAEAAAAAQLLFEERRVTKNYLAIVEGHILEIPLKEGVRKCAEGELSSELSKMRTKEAVHGFSQKRPRVEEGNGNGIEQPKDYTEKHEQLNSEQQTIASSHLQFIIDFPIAPVAVNDFRMRLGIKTGAVSSSGESLYDGQSASTMVEVLQLGYFEGREASKLLLTPITGRRHQLRLHTLLIGHPIIGDATYNHRYTSKVTSEDGVIPPLLNDESVAVLLAKEKALRQVEDKEDSHQDDEEYSRQRMLLHAWKLSLDFPWLGTTRFPAKRYKEAQKWIKEKIEHLKVLEVEAEDPFKESFSLTK